jgi:hypothetical protein
MTTVCEEGGSAAGLGVQDVALSAEDGGEEIVSEAVAAAVLPPTTIDAFDLSLQAFIGVHGWRFRTIDDATYFHMLPLDKKGKEKLLNELFPSLS